MAKVNLTIKDRGNGQVSFRLTSHPEARSNSPEDMSPAQKMGLYIVNHLSHMAPLRARMEEPAEEGITLSQLEGPGY